MRSQVFTIARNTFVECLRQPIFLVILLLARIAQELTLHSTGFSMARSSSAEVSGDDKLLLDLSLATVFLAGLLLAAFISSAVISREIVNKTVLTVVSKPISRVSVVLGKYVGVAAAMTLATLVMLLYVQFAIRHGVMSTAADRFDQPVIIFSWTAIALALFIGGWVNFFYGWSFTQTTSVLLLPFLGVAYVLVLTFSPEWEVQSLATDFKPQITLASIAVLLAVLVVSSITTALSARLGQVMTIVLAAGVFLLGLLSNHFFGRHAIDNTSLAEVVAVEPLRARDEPFTLPGSTYTLELDYVRDLPRVGTSLYYGQNPNGSGLAVPAFEPFEGSVASLANENFHEGPPAIVVTESSIDSLTIRNIGDRSGADDVAVPVSRPPRPGDHIFAEPTQYSPVAIATWGVIPNFQNFWLVDAVTDNQPIPLAHMGKLALYAIVQIGAFLSLAVILFQTREVG